MPMRSQLTHLKLVGLAIQINFNDFLLFVSWDAAE